MGMIDREKVIKGLKCHVYGDPQTRCHKCPYWGSGPHGSSECSTMEADALALLKAQEPRVMTLEEVKHFTYGSPYILERVLSDGEHRFMYGLYSHESVSGNFDFTTVDERIHLHDAEYGKTWRCWTSRPTDEQRKAVKWE